MKCLKLGIHKAITNSSNANSNTSIFRAIIINILKTKTQNILKTKTLFKAVKNRDITFKE